MVDKVTRWVLCLPDNTTARYGWHVPFLPLQLSSNSRLMRIKQGGVCFLKWRSTSYVPGMLQRMAAPLEKVCAGTRDGCWRWPNCSWWI